MTGDLVADVTAWSKELGEIPREGLIETCPDWPACRYRRLRWQAGLLRAMDRQAHPQIAWDWVARRVEHDAESIIDELVKAVDGLLRHLHWYRLHREPTVHVECMEAIQNHWFRATALLRQSPTLWHWRKEIEDRAYRGAEPFLRATVGMDSSVGFVGLEALLSLTVMDRLLKKRRGTDRTAALLKIDGDRRH